MGGTNGTMINNVHVCFTCMCACNGPICCLAFFQIWRTSYFYCRWFVKSRCATIFGVVVKFGRWICICSNCTNIICRKPNSELAARNEWNFDEDRLGTLSDGQWFDVSSGNAVPTMKQQRFSTKLVKDDHPILINEVVRYCVAIIEGSVVHYWQRWFVSCFFAMLNVLESMCCWNATFVCLFRSFARRSWSPRLRQPHNFSSSEIW